MRYVLVMLGSLVGLVIVAYLLYLLISVGCIIRQIMQSKRLMKHMIRFIADKVTAKEMIPALCDYVIFSEWRENRWRSMEQYEQIAWNVAKYGNASKIFYKVIVRENEYNIAHRLTPQYHSAFEEHLQDHRM